SRSGSIEGVSPTSGGPNLLSALSTAAAAGDSSSNASVGTWKLIKGKVSQTIEDIKSSKHHTAPPPPPTQPARSSSIPIIVAEPAAIGAVGWTNEPDSDTECITINTSVSEELEQQLKQPAPTNSDSEPEPEPLQHDSSSLGSGDVGATAAIGTERSRLRRGLAHIKSKVKAKQQAASMVKKEHLSHSSSSSPVAPSSLRSNFLRRRHHASEATQTEASTSKEARAVADAAAELAVSQSSQLKGRIVMARKDVEIESGVEVLEDMIPTASPDYDEEQPTGSDPTVTFRDRDSMLLHLSKPGSECDSLPTVSVAPQDAASLEPEKQTARSLSSLRIAISAASSVVWRTRTVATPFVLVGSLLMIVLTPIPDFLRGVLSTILLIFCIDSSSAYIRYFFEKYVLVTHPERTPFRIPNYDQMPICEIPAAEEHKTIKTYAGWLNEINSYDPLTFSFNLTRSVYVRLDGGILKLSGTNARIPKRRMWNEPPIDRSKILFTDHRSYDLRNARIELLPLGLAKKRYFNRKYPIQVIIKTSSVALVPDSLDTLEVQSLDSKTSLSSMGLTPVDEADKPNDFGAKVMQADVSPRRDHSLSLSPSLYILFLQLQELRNNANPDLELQEISMPCGDEIRLLLFARCDREKEDWYRRFVSASKGIVHEQDLQVPMARFVEDTDLQAAAAQHAVNLTMDNSKISTARDRETDKSTSMMSVASNYNETSGTNTPETPGEDPLEEDNSPDLDGFNGLIMSADVARNPRDYIKFMAVYQGRRAKRQENELWKGIDQSLFLGPSGSVVWANVIMGRCLFSGLHNEQLQEKIHEILQKKLNSIKLPSFMEDVIITNIYLGKSPMLFHRMSQPMLDERGAWLDADITYEGLAHITVTTRLNLLRVRSKAKLPTGNADSNVTTVPDATPETRSASDDAPNEESTNAIYDSDAESSGGSSTETESPVQGSINEAANTNEFFQNSPGNARRIFKIVDRIATSNLFQYATELPYVQRAMENMSANITLRVDLNGLVARGTLNIPPPPSDRVWLCFRGPPRLWISTKPQVGDKSVDWSIVTNVIESKLCEAVNKFLVYPNMVDFTVPFLGKPSYEDEPPGQFG
ncbi:hypothetical protein KR222_004593, partial [Zaprionus bogoriensis]